MMRFLTAGESHGPALVAIIEGFPAKVPVTQEAIDRALARRQLGHGRGGRMKIARDQGERMSGIRAGRGNGGPVRFPIEQWGLARGAGGEGPLSPAGGEPGDLGGGSPPGQGFAGGTTPRSGPAGSGGGFQVGLSDFAYIIERASA